MVTEFVGNDTVLKSCQAVVKFELEALGVLDVKRGWSERGPHQSRPFKVGVDFQSGSK